MHSIPTRRSSDLWKLGLRLVVAFIDLRVLVLRFPARGRRRELEHFPAWIEYADTRCAIQMPSAFEVDHLPQIVVIREELHDETPRNQVEHRRFWSLQTLRGPAAQRSEVRRVVKACVCTFSSRCSPFPS